MYQHTFAIRQGAISTMLYMKDVNTMKTAEEIIALLEVELAEAYEMHDEAKGKDAAQAFAFLVKASTIEQLLDEIKQG